MLDSLVIFHIEVGRSLSGFWRRGNGVKISSGLQNITTITHVLFHILPHAFLSTVEHKRRNINNVLVIFFLYNYILYIIFMHMKIHTYKSLLKPYNT